MSGPRFPVWVQLEPRLTQPLWLMALQPVLSVGFALLLGAGFLALAGLSPLSIYEHILTSAFVGAYALSDTAVKATPILLAGLGVAVAFRMRLWNIGAEGQLLLGAWAATGVALYLLPPGTPRLWMILTMMLAGAIAGGAWGAIAGALKAKLGVNEIISTLMLNYVAFHWLSYFVFGPWSEQGFQMTRMFPESAWLPRLMDLSPISDTFSGLTVHLGAAIGCVVAALLWWMLKRSCWGYEVRVIGDNPQAARYAGMPVERHIVGVLFLSGALAGLAGMTEVSGVVHRLQDRFSPGYGFTGIIVAWLAKLNPAALVLVSFVFGGLLVGGKEIQPAGIPQLLQGLILFVVVAAEFLLRYRVRIIRRKD